MKKNKKFGLWGIFVFLMFVCFSTRVFADDKYQVNLNSDNLTPEVNDSFTVLVNLSTSNASSCKVNISYDTNKLSFEKATGVDNYSRNPVSLTIKPNTTSQMYFKAISGGSSSIKVTSVENCGNEAGQLGSVDINVKAAQLSTLTITNGELSPSFNPNTADYTAIINADKTSINATAEDGITIIGTGEQTLNPGESKTIKIVATLKNGNQKTYSIKLSRPEEAKSENHFLKSITFNGETINIEQEKSTYSLIVKNSVENVDLQYELEDQKSKATVKGPDKLEVGINTFVIVVTAEDGSTKEYKLLVTRQDTKNIIDNDTEAILNEIENGDNKYIYVSVNQDEEDKIMDKTIAKALKKYEKTIIYEITNEDGDILYSVTLKGKEIKSENVDLNFGMTFKSDNKSKIDKLINNAKVMYLNFDEDGEIPGNLTIKVFVGDNFKNQTSLYLYYYNEKTNKLEKTQRNLIVKSGYVEFQIEKLGEYILSTEDFDATTVEEKNNNLLMYSIIGGGILLLIIIIIVVIIIKKKKKKNADNPKKSKKKKKGKTDVNPDEEQDDELEQTIVLNNSELNPSVIASTPSVISPENAEINVGREEENSSEVKGETSVENIETPESSKQINEDNKESTESVDKQATQSEGNNEDVEIIDDLKG